jgi:hypothetical protein
MRLLQGHLFTSSFSFWNIKYLIQFFAKIGPLFILGLCVHN